MAAHSITRTALYARISTSNNGQSPEMQLRELREYCERRGLAVAGECVDTGISGAKARRPKLDRLMADPERKAVFLAHHFSRGSHQPIKYNEQTFGPLPSPESNWPGTELTHGLWSARLCQSKSSDQSAGRAGQFTASSKI